MLEWILKLVGGDKVIAKYIGSLFRHAIPPVTAYLLALGLAPELVESFASHAEVMFGTLASVLVAVLMSLNEKKNREE